MLCPRCKARTVLTYNRKFCYSCTGAVRQREAVKTFAKWFFSKRKQSLLSLIQTRDKGQ